MSHANYPQQRGHGRPVAGPQQHGYPRQAPARPGPGPQHGYPQPTAPYERQVPARPQQAYGAPAARPAERNGHYEDRQPSRYRSDRPEQPARNGFGITALVLALVGLVFGFVPLTGFIALILGMLAVLFGLLGLGRVGKGHATNGKMSGISAVLGAGVAALGIWGIVIVFQATTQFADDMDQISRDLEQSSQEWDAYNDCVQAAGSDLDKINACELPS